MLQNTWGQIMCASEGVNKGSWTNCMGEEGEPTSSGNIKEYLYQEKSIHRLVVGQFLSDVSCRVDDVAKHERFSYRASPSNWSKTAAQRRTNPACIAKVHR